MNEQLHHPMMLEALLKAGVSDEALSQAVMQCERTGENLPVVISRLALADDGAIVEALADAFAIPVLLESRVPSTPVLPDVFNSGFLRSRRILPIAVNEREIEIALVDPSSADALGGVIFATGKTPRPFLIGFDLWRRAYSALYEDGKAAEDGEGRTLGARWTRAESGMEGLSLDAPAVQLVESLIGEAVRAGASDIHIERKPSAGLVRFRIDGRLRDMRRMPPGLTEQAISRLKVISDLDVSDHRRAQDGRTTISIGGRPVDIRLSIIPSAYGEGAVIRLLHRADIALDFERLGFSGPERNRISSALKRPQGFYLVAGPTGGGKTTTLYAALNTLRAPDRKIVTVEDPIEYFFEDVHQTGIDEKAGLGFASALRAFLRHDPDIVLVGEIRDSDTARTAVQASLTGHLVLSSIHASDAATVPARLKDMGVDLYLIASTLTAVTAQRLARRLCPECREPVEESREIADRYGVPFAEHNHFHEARGCSNCEDGYRGRVVISETLTVDDAVRDLIREDAGSDALRQHLETTMLHDGLDKARSGLTSLSEVLRVLEAN